jgi:TolB-like protein/tetratricopeptide (TPR) repeat protein
MLLLFLVGAAWYFPYRPGTAPSGASSIPSIAVLPFDDMSGNPELRYIGDGVAEDIISMLSRVPDLKVVARNSSFTYQGQPVDVRRVGRDLDVSHVLEGSIRKDADRLRIVAQLVDATTGENVWADRFDRSGTDPWALQDEVTEKIVTALVGDAGSLKRAQYREAWGKDSTSLGEYDYYLRTHDFVVQLEREPIERAIAIAEEGLSKFPESALLEIELGIAHFIRGFNGWNDNPAADYQKAGALVREAWTRPPLSPLERRLGHYLFAFVLMTERNFEKALSNAEAAIALSPYDVYMLAALSQVSVSAGEPKQALEWIGRAASLDGNPRIAEELAFYKGWALAIEGELDESLASLSKTWQDGVDSLGLQAIVLHRLGRTEEGKGMLKKALEIDPNLTQDKWRELFFHSDPTITDREIADLAALGLT